MNLYTFRTEPWLADEMRREHLERRNAWIESVFSWVLVVSIIALALNTF
jgi:hypothetical protein